MGQRVKTAWSVYKRVCKVLKARGFKDKGDGLGFKNKYWCQNRDSGG